MSKNEVLYVKGMDISESDGLEGEDDIWDDTQLNNAYDKALRMANEEVAKRIAMATNSKHSEKGDHSKSKGSKSRKSGNKPAWSPGMACRAIYEEDGLEYEAYFVKSVNDRDCVVKFIGYENSERVPMDSLQASHGKKAQQRQIEQAKLDQHCESDDSQLSSDVQQSDLGNVASPRSTERSYKKKSKPKKKTGERKVETNLEDVFQLPEMPVPNISKLMKMGSQCIPMPPPLPFPSGRLQSEDQAVSSMLLSWYMSGYYTGLYQGMKRSKQGKRTD